MQPLWEEILEEQWSSVFVVVAAAVLLLIT